MGEEKTIRVSKDPQRRLRAKKNFLKTNNNVFVIFRQDSDVWTPYGSTINKLKSMPIKEKDDEYINTLLKSKTKLAIWIVSNCGITNGASDRMKYITQLKKDGLNIDLGGKCFPYGVKKWKLKDYKFYFAFENSVHCKDYITEKFFDNAIDQGVVPVVFGPYRADYERLAPPHSFIYAQDYSNGELISLLNYLDQNDDAYKKYLEWRKVSLDNFVDKYRAGGFCQLCRILHGINYDYIFHRNYKKFFQNLSLFVDHQQERIVPSMTNWLYENENRDCMKDNLYEKITNQNASNAFVFSNKIFFFVVVALFCMHRTGHYFHTRSILNKNTVDNPKNQGVV